MPKMLTPNPIPIFAPVLSPGLVPLSAVGISVGLPNDPVELEVGAPDCLGWVLTGPRGVAAADEDGSRAMGMILSGSAT